MSADELYERRLRADLQAFLDAEPLPHPTWSQSPIAERVAGRATHRRRPLRLLALAALLLIGGAASVGAAWLWRPVPPVPEPTSNGWVALSNWNGHTSDIWFVRAEVQMTRVIGSDGDSTWEACPTFSLDGRMLAYSEAPDDSSDTPDWTLAIARLDANGLPTGAPARTAIPESASCPSWSPDGQRVAFRSTSGLHVIDLETRENILLSGHGRTDATVRPEDSTISDFEWAPDGRSLVYLRSTPRNAGDDFPLMELWSVTLGGEGTQILALLPGEVAESVAWAPDGSRIVVYGSIPQRRPDGIFPGTMFVRVIDADEGSEVLELDSWQASDFGLNGGPVIAQDGSLAYVREGALTISDLAGNSYSVPIEGLGSAATAACVNVWSAASDRVLVVLLDQPYLDRGVNSALVEVPLDDQTQPAVLLPWGSPYAANCGATWQVLAH